MISSNQARISTARSLAVFAAQAGKAAAAASMAARASVGSRSATSARISPVAGLLTAKVLPAPALVQTPST